MSYWIDSREGESNGESHEGGTSFIEYDKIKEEQRIWVNFNEFSYLWNAWKCVAKISMWEKSGEIKQFKLSLK